MIELKKINKTYSNGKVSFQALKDIDLKIEQGEFVAIMGASGSGKSTMLHILGFLDLPDAGEYTFFGQNIAKFTSDQLCLVRRKLAGFVFQQFHLLAGIKAIENVALPLVYAGKKLDTKSPLQKLSAVGLSPKAENVPNEMSGGERQRVAIARALINNPLVVFADEPTGNLDTASEAEIMKIFRDLNQQGITIIMVTHEKEIADQAERIITMRDGKIILDERKKNITTNQTKKEISIQDIIKQTDKEVGAEIFDHLKQAWRSIIAKKLRSILSMLGILIGVAAVIAMLAIGSGATKSIEADLSALGSNLLIIRPGSAQQGGVSLGTAAYSRLSLRELESLRTIPDIQRSSGQVSGRAQAVYHGKNWSTSVLGVEPAYALMRASQPTSGRFFNSAEIQQRARVALIGTTIAQELFGKNNPLGETIKLNKINFKIIGVLPEKGFRMGRNSDDQVLIPLSTAMYRLLGKQYLDTIETEIIALDQMEEAQEKIKGLLGENIDIRNMSDIQQTMKNTTATISLLLSIVAAISLFVGGIGIMNIMLVSVTERTREIGLRKAVGASRKDIMSQFLVEAVLMTVSGGFLGIALGALIAGIVTLTMNWAVQISLFSILLSVGFSVTTGIVFGLWPAKQAAELNTIEALRYE